MAIDPVTGVEAIKEAGKTTREAINQVGETTRENKRSEEKTKQKEAQEKYETDRKKTEGKEKTKQKEIQEQHETDRKKSEGKEQTEREKITAEKKTRENELNNNIKILDKVKNGAEKVTNIVQDNLKEVKNDYKEIIDKKETELVTSKEEIKEYQKSLMSAYGEVQRYKAVEEARNIVAKNIINYAEKKAKYDEEIKNLNYDVIDKEKELKPLQIDLNTIETSIVSLQDAYDELGRKFETVVKFMSELKYEHKGDLDPQKYSEKYDRKKRALKELIDDISNKELQLLEKEKERLDKIEEIDPILMDLKRTKKIKDLLENSREKFLTTGVLVIGDLRLENRNIDKLNTEDIIDVDASETSESKKLLN